MFKSKTPKISSALLLAATLMTLSHPGHVSAGETFTGNDHVESQGDLSDASWLLNHGLVRTSVEIPFTSQGATGPLSLKLDLSVNTIDMLSATDLQEDFEGGEVTIAPLEVKATVVQNGALVFAPRLVRVDAVKLIMTWTGITLQGIGYEFKNVAGFQSNGFHAAMLTINEAVPLKPNSRKGEFLALVLRGRASAGQVYGNRSALSAEAVSHWCDKKSSNGKCDNTDSISVDLEGSIGLRIRKSALIEIYGNYDLLGVMGVGGRNFSEATYGVKIRESMLDGRLRPYVSVEKRTKTVQVYSYQEETDSILLTIGLEANW